MKAHIPSYFCLTLFVCIGCQTSPSVKSTATATSGDRKLAEVPAEANAQDCEWIKGNTVVFGGNGSTNEQMHSCYPQFLALSHAKASESIQCLAEQINKSPSERFVIAGHSSGAGDAERLALSIRDKSRIRLVLLEGFAFYLNQRKSIETTCWYSRNEKGTVEGFNAGSMRDPSVCARKDQRVIVTNSCTNSLCMHLYNVNTNVPAGLSKATVFTEGLSNCQGNLEWVDENAAWLLSGADQ